MPRFHQRVLVRLCWMSSIAEWQSTSASLASRGRSRYCRSRAFLGSTSTLSRRGCRGCQQGRSRWPSAVGFRPLNQICSSQPRWLRRKDIIRGRLPTRPRAALFNVTPPFTCTCSSTSDFISPLAQNRNFNEARLIQWCRRGGSARFCWFFSEYPRPRPATATP